MLSFHFQTNNSREAKKGKRTASVQTFMELNKTYVSQIKVLTAGSLR